MLVLQLVGRMAGQIVDLPYAVATSCLAVGTARLPDVEVKGARVSASPAPAEIQADPFAEVRAVLGMAERFLTFKSAAAKLLGDDMPKTKPEIIAALEVRLV
jgi:hypothetical protein